MKKVWKNSVLVGILMLFSGLTFAQSYRVDTARLERAENRLIELLAVDKSELTKSQKKAWKQEKKQQKRIIANEMEKIRFNREMEYQWRYGAPYFNGFYNYGFGVGRFNNFYPYYGRFNRRPIIIRNQRCVVPNNVRASRRR